MSRLIRGPDAPDKPIKEAVIDDVSSLRLLKACQAIAVEHVSDGFQTVLRHLDTALDKAVDQARSNQDVAYFQELQRQVRSKRQELQRYFSGYVAEGFVKFRKGQLDTTLAQDADNMAELSLVDHDKLEEMLALSSISQRTDVYFAEPLWALNRRLSVLNRGSKVTEENNPAAPIQLCESLRRSLKLLSLDARARAFVYHVYDNHMFRFSGGVIQAANEYLREQGVLPHLDYKQPSGTIPGSFLAGGRVDNAPGNAAVGEQKPAPQKAELVHAIRDLQSRLTPAASNAHHAAPAPPADATAASSAFYSVDQVVQALANVQVEAVAQGRGEEQVLAPADVKAVVDALNAQLQQQEEASFNRDEMQTIDLVGMLFEYMLNDENLPDAVKALLSYLHTPFLKLAFVDPGFFEQVQHPARLLLNNLAEAGARWVRNDGTSEYGIYEKIKETVDRILRDFDNDVRVIAELLFEFSSHTKQITRRQELMEKRATEKVRGEERLRVVKQRVNQEVRQRTHEHELPSAVLLLLLQPWSDYLSFTLLRYGEGADQWHEALAVVDDILWCIEPKGTPAERERQKELRESILHSLDAGFETIGYDQDKARKLTDSVADLITQVMQRKAVEPAPAPVRDELERQAAEKAGDGDALQTGDLSPEEARMVENLKMIEFGTWLEFVGGRRLKVAWYNKRTSHYMLVDQMGKKAAMMSGLTMAREMLAGQARVISGSSKPFFDRALENIFEKLNAQAQAQASTTNPVNETTT